MRSSIAQGRFGLKPAISNVGRLMGFIAVYRTANCSIHGCLACDEITHGAAHYTVHGTHSGLWNSPWHCPWDTNQAHSTTHGTSHGTTRQPMAPPIVSNIVDRTIRGTSHALCSSLQINRWHRPCDVWCTIPPHPWNGP